MSAVEALARVLFEWNTPTDPYFVIKGRSGDAADDGDPYVPIVQAILADPGPLLAALPNEAIEAECIRRFYPQRYVLGSNPQWREVQP